MKRIIAAALAIAGLALLTPGISNAAEHCGHVPDPGGEFEWTVAAWKTDCNTAQRLGHFWAKVKTRNPSRSKVRRNGWLCRQGAQAFGWCELGKNWKTQKVVWVLANDQDVSTFRPRPEPATWKRCNVVVGPVALYRMKSLRVPCKQARRVGKKWNRKVWKGKCSPASCQSFGFRCVRRNLKQTAYYVSYRVKCKRANRRISWKVSLD